MSARVLVVRGPIGKYQRHGRGDSRSMRKARDRRTSERSRKSLGSAAEDRVRKRPFLARQETRLSSALRHAMRWPVVRRGKPLQAWARCPAQEHW